MRESRIVAFVMAGGEGQRLRPFTAEFPKPGLPFGGGHRIIDFALSNLHNSRIRSVFVLLQYRPQLLISHLAENWTPADRKAGEFMEAVLPVSQGPGRGFTGTADAVYQNLELLDRWRPDIVAVFAADHVYRMDVRQMAAFHEACAADATVAAVPMPREQASEFGIIQADDCGRIRGFQEKPSDPVPMPGDSRRCFASMGNYLFRPEVLRAALAAAAARGENDFGRHVLPRLIATHRVHAYDFSTNVIPGTRPHEEPAYWRDVGTVDAYVAAHWDLLGPQPRFCLDNPHWPIRRGSAARSPRLLNGGSAAHSIAAPGSSFDGASLDHAVLHRDTCVEAGATIEHGVIMDGTRVESGVRLRGVIVGPGNTLLAGSRIGHDRSTDCQRYAVTPSGIVVVPPRAPEGALAGAAPA